MPDALTAAPDAEAIRQDLYSFTARWHELPERGEIELRALGENRTPQVARFPLDMIEDAVEFAIGMNRLGMNIYAVRNPVRRSAKAGHAASDADVIAALYLWADCDDGPARDNVKRFDGPRLSRVVVTGRTPHPRVHAYWELAEWCHDLDEWRAVQVSIAAHFGSDSTVVNPSRIMRLAGTITHPASHKRAKGYVSELCETKIEGGAPVPFEQMQRLFAGARKAPAAAPGGLHIDTGEYQAKDQSWYADMLRRARTDGEKHGGVRDLAAHLAGTGVARTLAEAIIREACPVWDRNVENLIDTAYAKFRPAAPVQHVELSEAQKAEIPGLPFKAWQPIDLAAIPRPQFVYADFYARGYTSLTVAPPKVGKSMLGLAEAVDIASGRGFLSGAEREPARVLYYNAEDDQNIINARVSAILTQHGITQEDITGRLYAVSGIEAEDFYMVTGQEGLINEALFVALEKFIDQNGIDVLIFDPLQDLSRSPETNEVFRVLGQRLRRLAAAHGVAIGLIHHTRKMPQGGATATIDDARGGGALRGTARFNRLLVPMTEEEAIKAGVQNHRHFMRIGDMESNLAPPSADVNRWFQKVSVQTANGDYVGTVEPWQWPDAFDGVTPEDARRVQIAIAAAEVPPRANAQSATWAGLTVASVLGWDASEKAVKQRLANLIKTWTKTGVLEIQSNHDTRTGRDVPVIVAGPNNPMTEVRA